MERRFLSLSSVKSEYRKLCDEGGPVDIGVKMDKRDLETYCNDYPSRLIVPVLTQFRNDNDLARRHWPWAACAVGLYKFERSEQKKYKDEPTQDEVSELLSQIAKSAHDLSSALCRLQVFANRLPDHSAPFRRAHLAWLDTFITQAAAGRISNSASDDPEKMVLNFFGKMDLWKRLAGIEAAAVTVRKKHVDPALLNRERGQIDPALPTFVFRCARIWTSLTNRKPSAQKVHSRSGTDPQFVIFTQELAKVGQIAPSSRNQIATCLRKMRK